VTPSPDSSENPLPVATPAAPVAGRWLPWIAVLGATLVAGWFAVRNVTLQAEHAALRTERDLAELTRRQAHAQLAERTLLAERMINDLGSRLARGRDLTRLQVSVLGSPAGHTQDTQAIAVWAPDQETGLLAVTGLPALPADKEYQIWVFDPASPQPVNGGVFTVSPTGQATLTFRPHQPVKHAAKIAISLSRKGGAPVIEGPIVLRNR
jgi:hypothetical protein